MSESCPKCGSGRASEEQAWYLCDSCVHQGRFVQSDQCVIREKEAALAAATKRAEEYREKIEQLETDKANYHDKWWNALEKLRAAEQENARLREGIRELTTNKGGPDD